MEWLIYAAAISAAVAVGLAVWLVGTRPRKGRPCPTRLIQFEDDDLFCRLRLGHSGTHDWERPGPSRLANHFPDVPYRYDPNRPTG